MYSCNTAQLRKQNVDLTAAMHEVDFTKLTHLIGVHEHMCAGKNSRKLPKLAVNVTNSSQQTCISECLAILLLSTEGINEVADLIQPKSALSSETI